MEQALSGLTRRGWTFVAIGGGTTVAAIVGGSRDMLRIGLLLLLVPLLSVILASSSRVRLGARRTITASRVPLGQRATVRLDLSNRARISTGVLLVEDALPFSLGPRPRFVLRPTRGRTEVSYQLDPNARGRYTIGPLLVRVTDPFGMVELRRSFSDTSTLIVTPAVHRLPDVRLPGERGTGGRTRPRAISTATSDDDVTVRAYRIGDDMRRVHWHATAHHGELMVRREEQPWQNEASLLVDPRVTSHAGDGLDSSFEFGVTAAASMGSHLFDRGYTVRLVSGSPVPAGRVPFLDALAVLSATRRASVAQWPTLLDRADHTGGLLIAIVGALDTAQAGVLADLRHRASAAVAVLLDVGTWTTVGGHSHPSDHPVQAAHALRAAGWRVVVAGRSDHVAAVWQRIGLGHGTAVRPQPVGGPR